MNTETLTQVDPKVSHLLLMCLLYHICLVSNEVGMFSNSLIFFPHFDMLQHILN